MGIELIETLDGVEFVEFVEFVEKVNFKLINKTTNPKITKPIEVQT
jgi:hypothetical protein